MHGAKCHVKNCNVQKIAGTQACEIHQEQWNKHVQHHQRQTFSGARRMLQRPNESLLWQPAMQKNHQPHDEPTNDNPRDNYFTPNYFYCVETICAPCGFVISCAKFAKAESPTNILNLLEAVYPTEESQPDYVCIDKACLVLWTAIANGSWDRAWKQTTHFIVDFYHYINHCTKDYLCRKWCNPAPLNGSAPNLVIIDTDGQGQQYYKWAFNTQVFHLLHKLLKLLIITSIQACEQLNSWLGGYESILKRMTPGNFNWFCMPCFSITQNLPLKNKTGRLVVLKKWRRRRRMIQVTLYISFWCKLATSWECVSFINLNQLKNPIQDI